MKRFLYLLLAVAMLASFGCSGDTTVTSTPTGTDVISGVLRNIGNDGKPLANATIKCGNITAVTDADGNWTLGGVPATAGLTNDNNAPIYLVSIKPSAADVKAGYPSQVFRVVGSSQNGVNNVTIGKLNAIVRGRIVNANMVPVEGAIVHLSYGSDSDSLASRVGAAVGTSFSISSTDETDANGIFEIKNVETGAMVYVYAQTKDGAFSGMWPTPNAAGVIPAGFQLATADNFTNNLNAQYNDGVNGLGSPFAFGNPDLNLPLTVLAQKQISLDGGKTWSTGNINNGVFAKSATTVIRFNFNKEVLANAYTKKDPTSYVNDVRVNAVAKAGNVPFTIAFVPGATGYIKGVDVKFATGSSQEYTVNIADPFGGIFVTANSLLGRVDGSLVGQTVQPVVFDTDTGSIPAGKPALKIPNQGKSYAGDVTITWAPIEKAADYLVLARKNYSGVTTEYVTLGTTTDTTFNLDVLINGLAAGNPLENKNTNGTPLTVGSIFFDGINPVTYDVKVYARGTDKIVDEAKAANIAVIDKTKPVVTTNAHPSDNVVTRAKKAGDDPISGNVWDDGAEKEVTISFWAGSDQIFGLTDQMVKASVEAATFGISPAAAGGLIATIAPTNVDLNSGNVKYTLVVKSISYDQITRTAKLKFNIKYSFTAPASHAVNTTYNITFNPYLFTMTGAKDINGNAAVYNPADALGF